VVIWAIARGKQRMTVLVMEEQQGGTAEHDWNLQHSMSGTCPSIREKADSSFWGGKACVGFVSASRGMWVKGTKAKSTQRIGQIPLMEW